MAPECEITDAIDFDVSDDSVGTFIVDCDSLYHQPTVKLRTEFPETWLWENHDTGSVFFVSKIWHTACVVFTLPFIFILHKN